MENATEALQIVASFLIFVIALSISINAFGETSRASKVLLTYQDREYDYSYVLQNGSTQKTVGAESIVPSIYKAYKENYKIIFKTSQQEAIALYQKRASEDSNQKVSVYTIDLEKEVLGNDEEKQKFLKALLYGKLTTEENREFERKGIFFNQGALYDKIKNKSFKESLGVYYQEELQGEQGTPDANKTEKRVITYEEI